MTVECVIGILKRRFPVLRVPIPQWWPPQIHKIVYVCCMLSNFCHAIITKWDDDTESDSDRDRDSDSDSDSS